MVAGREAMLSHYLPSHFFWVVACPCMKNSPVVKENEITFFQTESGFQASIT
eukprot:m.13143 g.13143  ORF g.13143 m.13143 type:complete len:52 (+) comp24504_c0_seq2:1400-1555(+)